MTARLFEVALGIAEPWSVSAVDFDEAAKVLTVLIDFKPGRRFAICGPLSATRLLKAAALISLLRRVVSIAG